LPFQDQKVNIRKWRGKTFQTGLNPNVTKIVDATGPIEPGEIPPPGASKGDADRIGTANS